MEAELESRRHAWVYFALLFVVLAGAYVRFRGLYWGEYQYLHPDERFLVWVGTDISPVQSLGEYFDTARSSLNPHNRNHGFYVYGTLPMFVTRYIVQAVYGHSGFREMTNVGRPLSALADLSIILLVFWIAARLFDEHVGLLAAAFYAFAVIPIQQSHFFTMDTFAAVFTALAMAFAVEVALRRPRWEEARPFHQHPWFWPSVGFGLALGCAVASKINTAPVALILPAAMLFSWPRGRTEDEGRWFLQVMKYGLLAAGLSLLVFRVGQPYAFRGPGFFGLLPNPKWLDNLHELRAQVSGDVDVPFALQWARRTRWWFPLKNMVLWGMGLPLGVTAWIGFAWLGWRLLKGWRHPVGLLWLWTAVYFFWQGGQFNPTLRYFLPIYPTLAITAALLLLRAARRARWETLQWALATVVLAATAAWAFAFSSIYVRPITRVAASRWIYAHIPGPINLTLQGDAGETLRPIAFPAGQLMPGSPQSFPFSLNEDATVTSILLPHVRPAVQATAQLFLTISAEDALDVPLGQADAQGPLEQPLTFTLSAPVPLQMGKTYRISLLMIPDPALQGVDVCGEVQLRLLATEGEVEQVLPAPVDCLARADRPVVWTFSPKAEGSLTAVTLQSTREQAASPEPTTLTVQLQSADGQPLAEAALRSDFAPTDDPRGDPVRLIFDAPVVLKAGEQYFLHVASDTTPLQFQGATLANETSWDDGLPLRVDGFDGFGGIYQGLNLEMYWDDNADKRARMLDILNQADVLLITSSRQWGSIPRLPERYPLASAYYRALLGCPAERSIEWCYNVADVGTFQGGLGFDLVAVFQSDPALGQVRVNDQPAEEAFTVYDHPKVFIFQKRADYDPEAVAALLGAVDLSHVVHLTPRKAASYPGDLMLPPERLAEQRHGGTWAELFPPENPLNRSQPLAVAVWMLAVTLLGWITYPWLRLVMGGLPDRGFPLARTAGMLVLSYLVWLAGSFRVPFRPLTISVAWLGLLLAGVAATWVQRDDLARELRARKREFLTVEVLFLVFFLAFLLVRWGNPDLWHPWKGGEKPMDFSYFNAVLKSTSFPPYDPWYAGGYINYYYYGFVMVGVLVKWLGITPAVAYNLILPTLYALLALGAFSLGTNLVRASGGRRAWVSGLAATLGVAVLGNLGTVRMIYRGFQKLAAPGGDIDQGGTLTRAVWAFRGFFQTLAGRSLPYSLGDWYWLPSRAIPAPGEVEPITEFPMFTFLYADLHAHMMALPLTLLALSWALSVVLWARRARPSRPRMALALAFGALAVGVLRPTNTWDLPTYLAIGAVAVVWAAWHWFAPSPADAPHGERRLLAALLGVIMLTALALLFFHPYARWYGQAYTKVDWWKGTRTPTSAYLVHWGLFLFVIVSWMLWETRDWLANTPVTALARLRPYLALLWTAALLAGVWLIVLLALGVKIAWLAFPLTLWAGVLLLRPGLADVKRVVLFLVGTGLTLTLAVEVVVLHGDIARMNTVFKFYLQVWTLFAVSAAAALGWLLDALPDWSPRLRAWWSVALLALVGGAVLFPLMGGMAKVKDRMAPDAPHTLDGMAYMDYAHYFDQGVDMDLSQDARAIRWLQTHVSGSPVIVEANTVEYRWGTRYTIYTGLPGVIGWNWHQRQQRAINPGEWVFQRIADVAAFYTTTDEAAVRDFLRRYDVRYIVVGQLEQAYYPGPGLDKFAAWNGRLWQEVFRVGNTVVYKVLCENVGCAQVSAGW